MAIKETTDTPSSDPKTPGESEVTALLLRILRNVDRDIPSTPPLSDKAQAAVQTFIQIARDLRVIPQAQLSTGGSTSATPAASTPRSKS